MTFPQKLALCAALSALLSAPARPARAATACEAALEAGAATYDLGRFEAIPPQLAPCLHGKVSRQETAQAYSLLARAAIALDHEAEARAAVGRLLRADPAFEPTEPPLFVQMVREERRAAANQQVASVSRTAESLREAPATVEVITAEEIRRRGYLDLEQVLHDLPGFDISRDNGEIYSSFYQRGFRSNNTNRNLLLVDGMEQNDLASNVVYLSRQYPLSNVDRVEVLYGPASTMYGSDAYTGVINIITKDPEAFIPEGRRTGYSAQAGGGSQSTHFGDATVAGRDASGGVAWSLTGRVYHSAETDLSRFSDWNYNLGTFDYAAKLSVTDPRRVQDLIQNCSFAGCDPSLYSVTFDSAGNAVAVTPTAKAIQQARDLDQRLLGQSHSRFADPTDDWSLDGRLRLGTVTFGFQFWQLREGLDPWYTKELVGGPGDANLTEPRQASVFFRSSRSLSPDLTLQLFGRYLESSLTNRTTLLSTYANGILGLNNLLFTCAAGEGCPTVTATSTTSTASSSQFRTDVSLVYQPLGRLSAVGGLELRRSSVEGVAERFANGNFLFPAQHTEDTSAGLYAQASYALSERLKLVAGGRLDHSEINNSGGSTRFQGIDSQLSSRAALVYTPRSDLVLKAIYSDAFQDPSDAEKLPFQQDLRPETVKNFELAAGWQPTPRLSLTGAAFQARYHDVVTLVEQTACFFPLYCLPVNLLGNGGEYRIRGFQAGVRYRLGDVDLDGNYTFTDPLDLKPHDAEGEPLQDGNGHRVRQVRIADIASHRFNLGADLPLGRKLDLDLRTEYIGTRRTGLGTSDPESPLHQVPSAFVANATLSLPDLIPGATLQLIVRNLFNRTYYDPGVQGADGTFFAARVPQPGRTIYLRLLTGVGRARPTS